MRTNLESLMKMQANVTEHVPRDQRLQELILCEIRDETFV